MRIDPSLFKNDNLDESGPDHNIPPVVLAAIAVFSLLFLGGGMYLFVSGPFVGVSVIEPVELPEIYVAVRFFEGPLWKLEKERKKIDSKIAEEGVVKSEAITIFEKSPIRMRPLSVKAEVGYILGIGFYPGKQTEEFVIKKIRPGRRLIVSVKGRGNFSGNKAYKAADKFLKPKGLSTAEGERFEVRRYSKEQGYQVEHWVPVR